MLEVPLIMVACPAHMRSRQQKLYAAVYMHASSSMSNIPPPISNWTPPLGLHSHMCCIHACVLSFLPLVLPWLFP